MKYLVLVIVFFFSTILVRAHQPDISTVMIVQKDDGSWIVQIRAALTAFQQEVRKHYAETPYKTPEEFKAMVINHLQKNLSVETIDSQPINLENGNVTLGHETNVYFELEGLPTDFEKLMVENTSFSDIFKSKTAFIILKQNFEKKQVMLDENNQFSTMLITHGNRFEEFSIAAEEDRSRAKYLITIIFGIIVISLSIFRYYKVFVKNNTTTLAV